MATHDYIISNASGAAVRSDLNNALAAIVSNNSSATEPATTYAYMWWADTTSGQLKLRNAANDDWVVLLELDGTTLMEDGTVSAPGLAFADDLNTGFYRPAADSLGIATNGTNAIYIDSSQNVSIGSAQDTSKFNVLTGTSNSTIMELTGASAGRGLKVSTYANVANDAGVLIEAPYATYGQLAFGTAGTERVRIDSSGNVGIGKTPAVTLDVDGTVAADGGYYVYNSTNDGLGIWYNPGGAGVNQLTARISGSDRFTIDSSGRLLVGTSSARSTSTVSWLSQIEGGSTTGLGITSNSNDGAGAYLSLAKSRGTSVGSNTLVNDGDGLGYILFSGADGTDANSQAGFIGCEVDGTPGSNDMPGRLVFYTTADGASSPTERMRITSLGRVMIGTPYDPGYQTTIVGANSYACLIRQDTGSAAYPCLDLLNNFGTGNNVFARFYDNTALRGSITYNRAGGVTAYNTTSDYRAKTLIGDVEDSGETIDALQVYRGVMNGATVERPMLVAHEAQKVAPYCVTGEKDAVDDDGNPIYQQMDHQSLVPLLIAEVQQLRARVAALESA